MGLLQAFEEFIKKEHLFQSHNRLLLAVSGGVDSIVLCELCKQAGYDFAIAHGNFQLRGAESERDEQFVRSLADRYGKEIHTRRFETERYAVQNKISIQVAARELRYAWFNQILDGVATAPGESLPPAKTAINNSPGPPDIQAVSQLPFTIVTAHHLDDNIETMLMHFFRGTGISGLRGMLPRQGRVVRPLLFAGKEALLQFATVHGLNWVEDRSNQSDKYSRNYFRHQLVPVIKNIFPEADHNLADNLQRFREADILYGQAIAYHKKKLLEYRGDEVHIPVLKLAKATPLASVLYEITKEYGFTSRQVTGLIALMSAETGSFVLSATHRVFKNRNWLVIAPLEATGTGTVFLDAPGKHAVATGMLEMTLLTREPQFQIPAGSHIACMDAADIRFPLLLRKWKAGDYFYPLGMRKKKKLARFFIDLKLSKTDKEKIQVLESGKKIIWIVGLRIDDRFKVLPATRQVLRIELK